MSNSFFQERNTAYAQSCSRESEEFLGPSCQKMRNFIEDACEKQTLFANCEGHFERRRIESSNAKEIEEFVECTFNFDNYLKCQQISQKSINLANEMKKLSARYGMQDEVHLAVVWVYYFDYEMKETKSTPLFKVFQGESTLEGTFIDMDMNTYWNWEHFLEDGRLPESFICVPRRGTYNFDKDSGKLDLIYVRSPSSLKSRKIIVCSQSKPFCKIILDSILDSLKSGLKIVSTTFNNCVRFVCEFWNDPGNRKTLILLAINLAVIVCGFTLGELFMTPMISKLCSSVKMFFNSIIDPEIVPKIFTSLMTGVYPIISNVYDIIQDCSVKHLDKAFCDLKNLKVEHQPDIDRALEPLPNTSKLRNLLKQSPTFLETGSKILKHRTAMTDRGAGVNSKIAKKDTEPINLEEIEEFLKGIQINSSDKLADKIAKEADANETIQNIPVPADFPGSLYWFRSSQYLEIFEGLDALFKDYTILKRQPTAFDVIGLNGKIMGTLYHVNKTVSFLWVRDSSEEESTDSE